MVVNNPRLAWDAARAVVSASESHAHFVWLSDRVGTLLGPAFRRELADTRHRLINPAPDARWTETGAWRLHFDDLLRRRPDLANPVRQLIRETGDRKPRPGPYWPTN